MAGEVEFNFLAVIRDRTFNLLLHADWPLELNIQRGQFEWEGRFPGVVFESPENEVDAVDDGAAEDVTTSGDRVEV